MVHLMSHAGQVGYTDRETIFGLCGSVSQVVEFSNSVTSFFKKTVSKTITCFRPDGNRLDHTKYKNDLFESRYIYTYDEQGRRTGPKFYKNDQEKLDHYITFTYEANQKRRHRQDQWTFDDKLMFYVLFDYNQKGQRIQISWYQPDDSPIRTYHLTCDNWGNQVSIISTDAQGQVEWQSKSTFDESGNLLSTTRKSKRWFDNYFTRNRYHVFDEYGNWVQATQLSFSRYRLLPVIHIAKIYRTLEYFESNSI